MWMACATLSLPVPVSPVISTVDWRGPARRIIARSSRIGWLSPISSLLQDSCDSKGHFCAAACSAADTLAPISSGDAVSRPRAGIN